MRTPDAPLTPWEAMVESGAVFAEYLEKPKPNAGCATSSAPVEPQTKVQGGHMSGAANHNQRCSPTIEDIRATIAEQKARRMERFVAPASLVPGSSRVTLTSPRSSSQNPTSTEQVPAASHVQPVGLLSTAALPALSRFDPVLPVENVRCTISDEELQCGLSKWFMTQLPQRNATDILVGLRTQILDSLHNHRRPVVTAKDVEGILNELFNLENTEQYQDVINAYVDAIIGCLLQVHSECFPMLNAVESACRKTREARGCAA